MQSSNNSANFNSSSNLNNGQWNPSNSNNGQWNSSSSRYTSTSSTSAPVVEKVFLPTQVIEKPAAIHEEIRKELIEEVQPVINVEKIKTEVHQVTQPLFDKEVRAVNIEERTLAPETLPEVFVQGRGARAIDDFSTTRVLDTQTQVIEKPALYNEVDKLQVIEEIQPVIYKETVVPTVIQETKPVYQKIVEGTVYTQETLAAKSISQPSMIAPAYVTDRTVVAPTQQRVMLPTQVVEKPTAVHEEIRRETIEEVQPVINVEKVKTEVRQITAPLFDKEIRPVQIEKKILATEILPEVLTEGRGMRAVGDVSSTRYLDTQATLVEKPAIYNEIERTQIIEEIQPVVYKETVVPTVIRETKPVFQKIVEGPVYTQQTLAPRALSETNFHYPSNYGAPIEFPATVPVVIREAPIAAPVQTVIVEREPAFVPAALPVEHHGRREIIEETITTTTTTTTAPIVGATGATSGAPAKHGLFHRHGSNTTVAPATSGLTGTRSSGLVNSGLTQGGIGAPVEHFHNERSGPNGSKVIEDTTVTRSHQETVIPTNRI